MTRDEFIQDYLANHPLCILEEAERAWNDLYLQRKIDKTIDNDIAHSRHGL